MILWGKEHQERAEALASAYHEQASAIKDLPRGDEGIGALACADKTLTVWGHGGSTDFSEMMDVEFGLLIRNWKKANPSLDTVEIVTCDARHNADPLSGYATRVMKFVQETNEDIHIRALPVGIHKDDKSILWANAGTSSFCYITAPGTETFDYANKRLETLDPIHHNNLDDVCQTMAKERTLATPANFTVMGGKLDTLRDCLGDVM